MEITRNTHGHPHGQTIWVAEGIGLCQKEDAPIDVIRPGDRVVFEPAESHWHGASPRLQHAQAPDVTVVSR